MIVPDAVRKCVAFVGYRSADGDYKFLGSAFFIGGVPELGEAVHLVTARHVVERVRQLGRPDVYVRLNRRDGGSEWRPFSLSSWFVNRDPTVDVAVVRAEILDEVDHMAVHFDICLSDQKVTDHEVGLGDEVFVVGLFRHHTGSRRNIPIVRVGNLASLGEELIGTSLGDMDALLIEARSIGGLSGSPVFLNLGVARMIKGKLLQSSGGGPILLLLGLIHGHFDDEPDAVTATEDGLSSRQVNLGIAIVVPVRKILETLRASIADGG